MDRANSGIADVELERLPNLVNTIIHTAKPGVIIGQRGAAVKELREDLEAMTGKKFKIDVQEIDKPDLSAYLVAENIAQQLERRVMFRRAMKRAVQTAMRLGAEGVKINIAGRLNGAEIARSEWYREGRVPLHTLRADIDYGTAEAQTTYGIIGIKVWIFKGEVFGDRPEIEEEPKQAKGRGNMRNT